MAGTLDPGDEAPFPAMAPEGVEELSEQDQDKQNGLKQQAADALEDGNKDLALEKLTEAVSIGCASALVYSKRAQILMQLDRPRAAVNDCTAALAINPDSGKAYKIRGRAHAKLQMWEEAHSDFQTGLKIDYDEQTDEDSQEAAAKVKESKAAETAKRVKAEEEEYHRQMKANKEAYEAAMRARAQGSGGGGGKVVLECQSDYDKSIEGDRPVVILFGAAW